MRALVRRFFCALINIFNKTKQVYFTPQIIKKQAFPRLFSFYFYYCLTHQPAPEEGEEKGDDAADDIGDAQPFLRNVRGFYPKCDGKYPRYCKQQPKVPCKCHF